MTDQQPKKSPRKKFLLWGTAILSSLALWKLFPAATSPKKETVKMLSQDGTLVEIDKDLIVTTRKKISNKEILDWVKK